MSTPWFENDEKLVECLFEAVRCKVFKSCGDGDGFIITKDFVGLAKKFEECEARREDGPWFTERVDTPSLISFCHREEAIHFAGDKSVLPTWDSIEIVVEL